MPEAPQRSAAEIAVRELDRRQRVERYRQKRRDRAFVKKIRYEVRKLNAEQRPRFKGRFINQKDLAAMASAANGSDGGEPLYQEEPLAPARRSGDAARRTGGAARRRPH